MKKQSKIKAVIFDIGGVLEPGKYSKKTLRGHRCLSIHFYMAKKLRVPLDQWFDAIDTIYAKSIEGKVTKSKLLQIVSKNLGTSPKIIEKLWVKAFRKHFKKNKTLFKLAKKLKKQGYHVGILSDQFHISKEALIRKKDVFFFKPIIVSCDVGIRKPDIKIYKMYIKKAKINPKESVFIDNQKWNLVPAKKLGIKTILFKDNKQLINDLKKLGIKV